jgi:hypothetical protein
VRKLKAELAERGINTLASMVRLFVRAKGLSFKKTILPAKPDRPDIARMRARWIALQGKINPGRLVLLDETWVKTNIAPLRD